MENSREATLLTDVKSKFTSRFDILGIIGSGGMGTVFKAVDKTTGRTVALKVLHPELTIDKDIVERFIREAKLASKLNHPNIVRLLDSGSIDKYHYIEMDFIEGESLDKILETRKVLDEKTFLTIAVQVVEALELAHRNGIIHRDIKPSNILIGENNHATLLDLGVGTAIDNTVITRTGLLVGTPHYISPEQASGNKATALSDIYSLGVVFFHCLSGKPLYEGDTPVALLHKHIYEPVPPMSSGQTTVSKKLELIVNKMLAKDPELRYKSAKQLYNELYAYINDQPPLSIDTSFHEKETVLFDQQKTVLTNTMPMEINHNPAVGYEGEKTASSELNAVSKNKPKNKRLALIAILTVVALVIAFSMIALNNLQKSSTSKLSNSASDKAKETAVKPSATNNNAETKAASDQDDIEAKKNDSLVVNENTTYLLEKEWGSKGSDQGQFENVNGIAIDNKGNVYAADGGNGRVQKFDSNGNFIMQWGSKGSGIGQFYFPMDIAIDDLNGYVFVVDTDGIHKFNMDGDFLTKWAGNFDLTDAMGGVSIDIDTQGNIYAFDRLPGKIYKFSNNGQLLKTWDFKGNNTNDYSEGIDISIDKEGSIYVIFSGYDANGESFNPFVKKIGIDGKEKVIQSFSSEASPVSLLTDRLGNIYIGIYKNASYIYSKENKFIKKIENIIGYSAAIDKNGNIYTSEYDDNKIRKYKRVAD